MAMRSFPPAPALPRPDLALPCVARIANVTGRAITIEVAGHDEPIPARVTSTLSAKEIAKAHVSGHSAVVVYEHGDPSLPIVVGLLAPAEPPSSVEVETDEKSLPRGDALQADVDGTRMWLTAKDEIVLQCGKASITLRRNGRVVIRGAYVETHATGTNRVKGGQVLIN